MRSTRALWFTLTTFLFNHQILQHQIRGTKYLSLTELSIVAPDLRATSVTPEKPLIKPHQLIRKRIFLC